MANHKTIWKLTFQKAKNNQQVECPDSLVFEEILDAQSLDTFELFLHCTRKSSFIALELEDNHFGAPEFLRNYILLRITNLNKVVMDSNGHEINKDNLGDYLPLHFNRFHTKVKKQALNYRVHFENRIRQGIPANKFIPDSHTLIFDENNEASDLIINEETQQIWADLAYLILEGNSWSQIAKDMSSRFAHTNSDGKPYSHTYYYHNVYTPAFWGHSAHKYKDHRFQQWVYQEGEPIPNAALVYYDTHESVWKGELAEKIKHELDRRSGQATHSQLPDDVFKNILYCGKCAKPLQMRVAGMWLTWVCKAHDDITIRDRNVQKYMKKYIAQLVMQSDLIEIIKEHTHDELEAYIQEVQLNIEEIPLLIDKLYECLANAEMEALKADYIDLLGFMYIELERLEYLSIKLSQERAFNELLSAYPDEHLIEESQKLFWQLPDTTINRLLKELMDDNKLIVLNGQITGITSSD